MENTNHQQSSLARSGLVVFILCMLGLGLWLIWHTLREQPVESIIVTETAAETVAPLPLVTTHVVRRGQSLGTIARDWAPDGTTGIDLVALNEAVLAPVFVERCEGLSEAFRTREAIDRSIWERGGGEYFCNITKGNDNFPAWANSLVPGDIIYIPTAVSATSTQALAGETARNVNTAVAGLSGNRIVLVVDASGSMDDASDRAKVTALYNTLLTERILGIVAFAETATVVDNLDFSVDVGNTRVENIGNALQTAAGMGADAIILIGDEPGDDIVEADFTDMPPVTAHCIAENNTALCTESFTRIATVTGGQYIE
jgi:hypothetical protein